MTRAFRAGAEAAVQTALATDITPIFRTMTGDAFKSVFNTTIASIVQNAAMVNAPAAITAATTDLLTVGTDDPVQFYTVNAGAGAYAFNIDLDTVGAKEGNFQELNIAKAASTNPTINIRNGSGGTNIVTAINNASAQNWYFKFVFDGTNWVRLVAHINDL